MLPGTQESGHMCSRCCHGPESFPTWGCQFCRDWQFLSVLNRILCNHLLLHLDILYLETRHLSPILLPTFSFTVADAGLHTQGGGLLSPLFFAHTSSHTVRILSCLLCWPPRLPLTAACGGLQPALPPFPTAALKKWLLPPRASSLCQFSLHSSQKP